MKETGSGNRGSAHDTHPTDGFPVCNSAHAEIQANGNAHRQHRTNELAHGQAKKYCFLVVADFFVDFDFHANLLALR